MARNPERGGGIVSSVLISLAAAAGITVIGLGAGVGVGMVIYGPLDAPADQSAPAQVQQEQDAQAPKKGSYIGPTLMIENGEVVWRRDSSGQDQSTPEPAESPVNPPEDSASAQSAPANAGTPVQPEPDAVPTPAPQPESPAASAGQSTGSAEKPATKTPSSSDGTSSGSKVTAASNQTQSNKSNSGTSSNTNNGGGKGNADNFNAHYNPDQQKTDANYVLNTNTKKFHYPTCGEVSKIAEKNYQPFYGTRSEAISMNYKPCGKCNP